MEKEKIKELYEFLELKYKTSIQYEKIYRNGKNQQIRKNGLKDLRFEIDDLEYQAGKNKELFDLILPNQMIEPNKSISYDELLTVQYFTRELEIVLERIKKQLKS